MKMIKIYQIPQQKTKIFDSINNICAVEIYKNIEDQDTIVILQTSSKDIQQRLMNIFQDADEMLSISSNISFKEIFEQSVREVQEEEKNNLVPKQVTAILLKGQAALILDFLQRAMILDKTPLLSKQIYSLIYENTKEQLPDQLKVVSNGSSCCIL